MAAYHLQLLHLIVLTAMEVFDVELQTQMVIELDGYVMKCVRDQNGNHVIQKCIEYVPQDRIHFIVASFFGQAVSLSTHPYGCHAIQRVLEHCNNPETQKIMMDEIVQPVGSLVLDRYGNYVIQARNQKVGEKSLLSVSNFVQLYFNPATVKIFNPATVKIPSNLKVLIFVKLCYQKLEKKSIRRNTIYLMDIV